MTVRLSWEDMSQSVEVKCVVNFKLQQSEVLSLEGGDGPPGSRCAERATHSSAHGPQGIERSKSPIKAGELRMLACTRSHCFLGKGLPYN